jgi:hypothetical protein
MPGFFVSTLVRERDELVQSRAVKIRNSVLCEVVGRIVSCYPNPRNISLILRWRKKPHFSIRHSALIPVDRGCGRLRFRGKSPKLLVYTSVFFRKHLPV